MATKKNTETGEVIERVEDSGAIPDAIQSLQERLDKIEKKENEFINSQSFVNRGPHPNQIP